MRRSTSAPRTAQQQCSASHPPRHNRMRQLIIDTETTGLDPQPGPPDHRDRRSSSSSTAGRPAATVHFKINPEREIDVGATEVHGMTWDDLQRQAALPRRRRRVHRVRARRRVGDPQRAVRRRRSSTPSSRAIEAAARAATIASAVVDTLHLAREAFPGKRNNLDALCERFARRQRAARRCTARCSTRSCFPRSTSR